MQSNFYGGYSYPPQRQNTISFVLVNSEAEAQAYIAYPGQTVYLLDYNNKKLTIKKSDVQGVTSQEDFILSKNEQIAPEYVTKAEFEELQKQIKVLIDREV
jgi:hypothetical protein